MKHQKAKFLLTKEQEKLIGNSGCKLSIYKDGVYKIRKQSTNKFNSNRLFKQSQKILKFKNYRNISVANIYTINQKNKLFYLDLEYINGSTLSLYLMSQPLSLTYKIINQITDYIFNCKKNSLSRFKKKIFLIKIENLYKKKKFRNKFFSKIFDSLKNYKWENIEKSQSHGDLSLENIIIKDNKIKFIDLSENFAESYKLDISKIIFDLICLWSFRNVPLRIDDLKIYYLKVHLLKIFFKKLSKNDIKDVKMLIILDFIRVLDYTNKNEEIKLLKKKLKHFYDNIDYPMRW